MAGLIQGLGRVHKAEEWLLFIYLSEVRLDSV
jgi:hypothetical protein